MTGASESRAREKKRRGKKGERGRIGPGAASTGTMRATKTSHPNWGSRDPESSE